MNRLSAGFSQPGETGHDRQQEKARIDTEKEVWKQLRTHEKEFGGITGRLIDEDDENQAGFIDAALIAAQKAFTDLYPGLDKVDVRVLAYDDVNGRFIAEVALFDHIVSLLAQLAAETDEAKKIEMKSRALANLGAKHLGVDPDNPWLAFADSVLPGPRFDFQDAQNSGYIEQAIQARREEDGAQIKALTPLIDPVIGACEVYYDVLDEGKIRSIMAMLSYATRPDSGYSVAGRQAYIAAELRKNGVVDRRAIEEVITILEAKYPIE